MLKKEYAHSININLLLLASINIARFLNNLRSCKDDFGALVFHESRIRPTCRIRVCIHECMQRSACNANS